MLPTRPRVLVADDHPGLVKALGRFLSVDCEVVGASDGTSLLEATQRLKPDVIVLDVNLPNVDSLEVCRAIRRLHPAIKVIVFTAMDDSSVRQAFVGAGATAFVSKLAASDLLETIQRLCLPSR